MRPLECAILAIEKRLRQCVGECVYNNGHGKSLKLMRNEKSTYLDIVGPKFIRFSISNPRNEDLSNPCNEDLNLDTSVSIQ
jgi:hypothetical protein